WSAIGLQIIPSDLQSGTKPVAKHDRSVNGSAGISSVWIWSNLCSPGECFKYSRFGAFARLDALKAALYTSAVFAQTIDRNPRACARYFSRNMPCHGVAT